MKKIFIGCPITKYLDHDVFTDDHFRAFIEGMYDLCSEYADEVFLALKREEFGKKLMTDVCTELDFEEMKTADLVVAIPEDSKGTAVELGWASAMKKKIILVLDRNCRYTPLIYRLGDITETISIWYDGTLDEEVLRRVSEAIKAIETANTL
ncbi:MAG: nucleoside 2-deoxyribosyltransferase [Firmicutes bacterium]|nr:nucleoside 2-deoxyribosyltransferase [Bacillota bacterium]